MDSVARRFSKRRLSLTLRRNRATEIASDTRSERGALSNNKDTDSDSDSVADNRGYDSDDEYLGMDINR